MSKENNKNSGERRGFIELLAQKTALPSDLILGDFRLEIRGRSTLFMQGCRRILKYSPEEMIMAAKGFDVDIKGRRLVCTSYHDGTVTVEGVIGSLEFLGGEEE